MSTNKFKLLQCVSSFILAVVSVNSSTTTPLVGVHPLDEKYFESEIIRCKDGSKSFPRDRLNDNFCDCLDGTDEPGTLTSLHPNFTKVSNFIASQIGSDHILRFIDDVMLLTLGTSACPNGKFYCRNTGSSPEFVYSSRVNDQICDCCDGSDEYESSISCPNTCIMGGNVNYIYKPRAERKSIDRQLGSATTDPNSSITIANLQDMVKNLQGMKLVFVLQFVLIGFLVILWMLRRRVRSSKRRRYLLKSVHPNRSANN